MAAATSSHTVIPKEEAVRFIKDCLEAVGTPIRNAAIVAEHLVQSDYRGHMCQGMNKLETYLQEIQHRACDPHAAPKILKEAEGTAWVDGRNGLGVIVAEFCMDLAIKKAKKCGVGLVVAKGTNRFGTTGVFAEKAIHEGMVGLAFSNGPVIVAPTRTSIAALGTNPMAFAAPAVPQDTVLLDMSTSAVTIGKVELLSRQHLPVPPDWVNMKSGALRPIGGQEPNSNYKGFGLGLMVELLTGVLGGAKYGYHHRKYGDYHQEANLGQTFMAINTQFFAPGYKDRVSDLVNNIRQLPPDIADKPVLVPGDKEREHMAKVDSQGGILYPQDQLTTCLRFADELNVQPLLPLSHN